METIRFSTQLDLLCKDTNEVESTLEAMHIPVITPSQAASDLINEPAHNPPSDNVLQAPVTMADPFEVRMRFTKQLQHLNASVTAAQKAAQYALKYRDMDEDLHSCIVEQLEQVYTT